MIAPTSFFADYGCHVRILEEARVLQRLGCQVKVATYHNGKDVPGVDIERTLPIPWRRHYEVGSSRHKIVFDALLGIRIAQTLLTGRVDIIHAHLHEGALMGLILGWPFHIPTIFDFQGSMTEEMLDHGFLRRDSQLFGPVRHLETWIARRSPIIFTNSANARRVLVNDFGCTPNRLRSIPDCVNTETFRPASQHDADELAVLRARLGIPADHRVLVYLGLLAEYQGVTHLLEAFRRLLARRSHVTLLLMGFPGVDVYQQKVRDLGIDSQVIFTGRIPYHEAPTYLALGDAAAAPKLSLTEGAGKLLNYMAVGLPTVAFDTPVAREYLGAYGLFAIRGDVDSLAEQLEQALFNDDRRPEIGRQLHQRAVQQFDWTPTGRDILQAYADLLGDEAPAASAKPISQIPKQSV